VTDDDGGSVDAVGAIPRRRAGGITASKLLRKLTPLTFRDRRAAAPYAAFIADQVAMYLACAVRLMAVETSRRGVHPLLGTVRSSGRWTGSQPKGNSHRASAKSVHEVARRSTARRLSRA